MSLESRNGPPEKNRVRRTERRGRARQEASSRNAGPLHDEVENRVPKEPVKSTSPRGFKYNADDTEREHFPKDEILTELQDTDFGRQVVDAPPMSPDEGMSTFANFSRGKIKSRMKEVTYEDAFKEEPVVPEGDDMGQEPTVFADAFNAAKGKNHKPAATKKSVLHAKPSKRIRKTSPRPQPLNLEQTFDDESVTYKVRKANFNDAEPTIAQGPATIILNPDSLAKARNARDTSVARLRTNNAAHVKERALRKNRTEHAEAMGTIAEEHLADIENEQEVLRGMVRDHALSNQNPETVAAWKEKLEALLSTYGPESPAMQEASRIYQAGDYISATPKSAEISKEQIEEAARIYQTGDAFASAPKSPEIRKKHMEEAARIYQTGDTFPAAPVKTVNEARERAAVRASKELSNQEFLKTDGALREEEGRRKEVYFRALAAHQRRRGFWDVTAERLGLKKGKDTDQLGQLHALRAGWIETLSEKAKLQLDSIEARRQGRGGATRQTADMEKIRARYQRMYVTRQAVFGAANEEQKVRQSALDGRRGTVADGMNKWYSGLDPKAKVAWSSAIGMTAFTAGTVLTAGSLGVASGLAGAGVVAGTYGGRLRYRALEAKERAEKALANKDEKTYRKEMKQFTKLSGRAKWFSASGIGGWLTGLGVGKMQERSTKAASAQLAETTTHKDKQGNDVLRYREVGNLADKDYFANLVNERRSAAVTLARNQNARATASAVGGLAAGVGAGAALGSLGHHIDNSLHPQVPAGHGAGGGVTEGARTTGATAAQPEHAPVHHDPAAEHGGFHSFINRRGEGGDLLYKDLHDQLAAAYKDIPNPPPVVAQLLKYDDMDAFSRAVGFEDLPNSAYMHGGIHPDTLVLSADAKTLTHMDSHGVSHTLMHEKPDHTVEVTKEVLPMQHHHRDDNTTP